MNILHLATTYPLFPGDSNAVFVERIYIPRAFLPLSVALVSDIDMFSLALMLCLLLVIYVI